MAWARLEGEEAGACDQPGLRVCMLVTDIEGSSGSQGPGRALPVVRVGLQADGGVTSEGAVRALLWGLRSSGGGGASWWAGAGWGWCLLPPPSQGTHCPCTLGSPALWSSSSGSPVCPQPRLLHCFLHFSETLGDPVG